MTQVIVQTSITLLIELFLSNARDIRDGPTILQEQGIFVLGLLLPFLGWGTEYH